jgi:hypothetical protein
MKADIGISSYPVKVAGVIISVISVIGFAICKLAACDPAIIENLHLIKLFFLLFACGLVLFLFSKDRKNVETYIQNTNMISRYFLTALYSGLIAFSLIQSMNNDYTIDVMVPVLFFLILQIIYTLVIQYHNLSNKGFYIFSTIVFVAGLIVLLLL